MSHFLVEHLCAHFDHIRLVKSLQFVVCKRNYCTVKAFEINAQYKDVKLLFDFSAMPSQYLLVHNRRQFDQLQRLT